MSYTTITDARINTDSPITFAELSDLRDNPIAIASGDSGAPRVQYGALTPSAWDLISTYTCPSSGQGDAITFTSAAIANYDHLLLIGLKVKQGVSSNILVRTGNGGTFDTSGYTDSRGSGQTGALIIAPMGTDPSYLEIYINGAGDASTYTFFRAIAGTTSAPATTTISSRSEDAAHDRIQIIRGTASGEFIGGEFALWGRTE